MDYLQAREFINSRNRNKIVLGLDRIRELCTSLGNPQNKTKIIHIAGTNGKGSVGAFIAQVLISSGYKVGRYTSPEVLNYREKFTINNKLISEDEFSTLMDVVSVNVEAMTISPTAFEIETALAYYYFEQNDCDFALIECGMGGREDATNVADHKIVSVLTSVALDHTKFLGDTLEKIALEKIGIVKGSPLVSCEQATSVVEVIKRHINDYTFSDSTKLKNIRLNFEGTTFDYKDYEGIKISMLGRFQCENASLALEVIDKLKSLGYKIDNVAEGMKKATWPCRFDLVSTEPIIIIDGAHNPQGAMALKENIEYYLTDKSIAFIIGVLADKDYESLVENTASLATSIYTVTPDSPRALSADDLAICVKRHNSAVEAMPSLERAIDNALADGSEAIIIFGSLSFLGEAYKDLGGIALE